MAKCQRLNEVLAEKNSLVTHGWERRDLILPSVRYVIVILIIEYFGGCGEEEEEATQGNEELQCIHISQEYRRDEAFPQGQY